MTRILVLLLAVGLVFASPALASEQHPTLSELEHEVMCPVCKTLLALSDSPAAQRIRVFIRGRIAAGATKSQIKDEISRYLYEQTRRRPLVFPVVVEV